MLRGRMKRVIGRVLSVGGEIDFRIGIRLIAVIRWGRLHRGIFAGCVSWMGAAVVISELEIIRMSMGRVLRLLLSDVVDFRIIVRGLSRMVVIISELGDVVDFRIGDRVMVHAWLEREGGMILVAARRLSERERVAHNESVLR